MESNYTWATLLSKYVNNDISPHELEQLHSQMASSIFKREQFDRVTAPDYYPSILTDLLKADDKADQERFRKKLCRAIKNQKLITRLFCNRHKTGHRNKKYNFEKTKTTDPKKPISVINITNNGKTKTTMPCVTMPCV